MNFILGSGIVGLLAKRMYPEFELIPFKRSRYYSFEIVLADNFLIYNKKIDDFMNQLGISCEVEFKKQAYSLKGQLIFDEIDELKQSYFSRVYGYQMPSHIGSLIKNTVTTYPKSVKAVHDRLVEKSLNDFMNTKQKYGELVSINFENKKLYFTNREVDFDKIISTIPLDALCQFCNIKMDLKSRSVCYYDIQTSAVDLEGASSCIVIDDYEFFKVVPQNERFLFWTFDKLEQPYKYFGQFFGYNFDIIESFRIDKAIPIGEKPNLDVLEGNNVYCVGSNAQWDDFMDVSSCVLRLINLSKNII